MISPLAVLTKRSANWIGDSRGELILELIGIG